MTQMEKEETIESINSDIEALMARIRTGRKTSPAQGEAARLVEENERLRTQIAHAEERLHAQQTENANLAAYLEKNRKLIASYKHRLNE